MPDTPQPAPEQNPPQPTDPIVPPMRDPPATPYRDPVPPPMKDPPDRPMHDPDPPPFRDPPDQPIKAQSAVLRNRSALATTLTDERAIAAAPTIGESRMPSTV